MSAGEKRELIEKIQTWAKEKFCGSGDPEVEDAFDCIDFFESTFGERLSVFAELLQDVSARVEALDTSFLHDPGITHVPQTPAEGDTHRLKLAPWMLGFRATDSIKGKSKMTQLFKCLIEFLEKPYASVKDPIDVLMPLGAKIGGEIPVFSVRHSVGFAKSLTVRLILFSVVDMRWQGPVAATAERAAIATTQQAAAAATAARALAASAAAFSVHRHSVYGP
jgi:hypothetical protein